MRLLPQIAEGLIEGANAVTESAGGEIDLAEVPGALEIPRAIALAAGCDFYDGYVALGCVVGARRRMTIRSATTACAG